MANWFKKIAKPVKEEVEEVADGPADFFEEILELNQLDRNKKNDLVHELEEMEEVSSVESELLMDNAKKKDHTNPWHD